MDHAPHSGRSIHITQRHLVPCLTQGHLRSSRSAYWWASTRTCPPLPAMLVASASLVSTHSNSPCPVVQAGLAGWLGLTQCASPRDRLTAAQPTLSTASVAVASHRHLSTSAAGINVLYSWTPCSCQHGSFPPAAKHQWSWVYRPSQLDVTLILCTS